MIKMKRQDSKVRFDESVINDTIINHYQGKIVIKDNVFELKLEDGSIISGDISEEISKEYLEVHCDDFFGTIGKSIIYNKEVDRTYEVYRLIEMIV